MVVALFLAMPVILAQVWGFIAPGLATKRVACRCVQHHPVYAGMAFAYFLVFPMIFHFFASVTPEGVAMMTDINSYLDSRPDPSPSASPSRSRWPRCC